jgi:hypothetical protein
MNAVSRAGYLTLAASALAAAGLVWTGSRIRAEGEVKKNTKYPQYILIIRHAEKTGAKEDVHLSREGKERAEVLERLFTATADRPDPFPTPDFLFAAHHHKDSQRPVETLTPLARKLGLPILDRYDSKLPAPPGRGEGPQKGRDGGAKGRAARLAEVFRQDDPDSVAAQDHTRAGENTPGGQGPREVGRRGV